jgi:hypothetical protein
MSSPFPGMDPYLEDPVEWVSFHSRLIGVLDEMLSAGLRPHFYVAQPTAVYLIDPSGTPRWPPIMPDVFVAGGPARAAVVEDMPITAPTIVIARYPEEVRQRYLEIRHAGSRTVVAVIEILSPTNKAGKGAEDFDRKRQNVMASPVHWLEIDLLRSGQRFPPIAGRSDYCVLLKRGGPPADDGDTEFPTWFIDLRDPLPRVAVPLTPAFPDAALDLHAAFTTVYDRFYAGRLDYASPPPPPPLQPADVVWAAERIRMWQAVTRTE